MKAGERQVGPTIDGIRRDHVARYEWAATQLAARDNVVDVACGVGYGSHFLAQAGHQVLGVDVDPEALEYARQHYQHDNVRYSCADASRLDIGEFDAAVCFETIEHLADPLPLLQRLRKSVPRLLASVPNEAVFPWKNYAFHYRHYTKAQFEELLLRAGWQVVAWFGQAGPESEVEAGIDGRTLIALAERAADMPAPVAAPVQTSTNPPTAPAVPKHVAILGLGPSVVKYLEFVKRLGGRRKFCDEVWAINALGDLVTCDRIFHMDDVRIQELRAAAAPDSNVAVMLQWLKQHPGPIYTSRTHPDYPGLVEFPLEDVINSTKYAYFNSTAAYAVAYAVHLGVRKMTLFGMDFTYPNVHQAEKGRACVEFWLGMAAARGIELSIPHVSSLMDGCTPGDRLYGYDTLHVSIEKIDGRIKVAFNAKAQLPTAAEIEARYDHSAHPNPLMES